MIVTPAVTVAAGLGDAVGAALADAVAVAEADGTELAEADALGDALAACVGVAVGVGIADALLDGEAVAGAPGADAVADGWTTGVVLTAPLQAVNAESAESRTPAARTGDFISQR